MQKTLLKLSIILARRICGCFNSLVFPLIESWLIKGDKKTILRPVTFIVGPPRCGSTLVMQVLTDAFQFGYLSNCHCTFFGAPALAEYWHQPLKCSYGSTYSSTYGSTTRRFEPAECGAWWYRFFRREPPYVTTQDVTLRKMGAFRRSLITLEQASGRPLIFKNLYATLRLEPLARYLPEALYVVIERDWVDNAQSILKARKEVLGRYEPWWSVPPPNVDKLDKLPPVRQVAGQIASIHNLINRDIMRLGLADRTFRISYEDFCEDVHGMLERYGAFMARHGVVLHPRMTVPPRFIVNHSIKIPEAMYEELVAEVHALNVGSTQGD